MVKTQNYREQHVKILNMINDISEKLKPHELEKDAHDVRMSLSELMGTLLYHINIEDKFVYPLLLETKNEAIKLKAHEFITNMGYLKGKFEDFNKRWASAASIQNKTDTFVDETREIFRALKKRIIREDDVLYKMVDELEDNFD